MGRFSLITIFFFFFFLFCSVFLIIMPFPVSSRSFETEDDHEGEADPTDIFVSCLTQHGIKNLTVRSSSTWNDESSAYNLLLKSTIQNLRFTGSSLPKPAAIVFPESKEQLANIVVCARRSLLEIRVRCGGHSYEGTSYVAMDGAPFVLIDLTKLDRVSVDVALGHAWVEGGATLGQTYHAVAQASGVHGFSAGSCPTVGVGGHISGGGFGLLSRKYGLAADNVVDAILVNGNGELLNREGMGEDVFWAIRGGGGGTFGVVYAWKVRLVSVPETVTSFTVFRTGTKSQVLELVNKWQHVAPMIQDDFYLSCFVGAGLPERKNRTKTGVSATFKGFYLGPRSKAFSVMNRSFPELRITEEDCNESSWIESVLFFSGLGKGSVVSDLKNRYLQDKLYYKAKSDYVRRPIPRLGLNLALEILEREPKGYVILDPYGGAMQDIDSKAIAFPHRKGNLFVIQYLVEWKEKDEVNSNGYIDWIREFHSSMTPYVSSSPRAAYVNYMDLDLGSMDYIASMVGLEEDNVEMARKWGEKYFGKNYDRLVRAKTQIDPYNVFRHQQSIPPMSMARDNPKATRLDSTRLSE